jgi:hypothetical protein
MILVYFIMHHVTYKVRVMMFNSTFNNISDISWQSFDSLTGGSGGGNGAAGGQGKFQTIVGPPPSYGSMYTPKEYGGNGGAMAVSFVVAM